MTHALIIDDNGNNLNVLAELLQLEGVAYTKLQNPNQLETVLADLGKIDVVFLDLEMPGRDGYQIFELLKARSEFQQVPIVAYTVHVSEINAANQMGFDSFLGKPLDADRFPQQLQAILSGRGVWTTV